MKIFVGYESEFPEAYGVCRESILRFNDKHEIIPLVKEDLEEQGIYTRKYEGEAQSLLLLAFLSPTFVIMKDLLYFVMETFCGEQTQILYLTIKSMLVFKL